MMRKGSYFYLLFVLVFVFSNSSVKAQARQEAIIKIGANPCGYDLVLHIGVEKYFKRIPFLTHGPGIDFLIHGYAHDAVYRYNFAFYPLYGIGNKGPYNWLYIGAGPVFYHGLWGPEPTGKSVYTSQYGPGLSAFIGLQFVLKNRFTLGADFSLIYFENLKKNFPSYEENGLYITGICSFKFGFIIK